MTTKQKEKRRPVLAFFFFCRYYRNFGKNFFLIKLRTHCVSGLGPAWFAIHFDSLLIRNRINQTMIRKWVNHDSTTFDFDSIWFWFVGESWFANQNQSIRSEPCCVIDQRSKKLYWSTLLKDLSAQSQNSNYLSHSKSSSLILSC